MNFGTRIRRDGLSIPEVTGWVETLALRRLQPRQAQAQAPAQVRPALAVVAQHRHRQVQSRQQHSKKLWQVHILVHY